MMDFDPSGLRRGDHPEPPTPDTWRRLRDLLSPTKIEVHNSDPDTLFSWIEGCLRLRDLEIAGLELDALTSLCRFSGLNALTHLYIIVQEEEGDRSKPFPVTDGFASLSSLSSLKELVLVPSMTAFAPAACAPLAALTALTALTLPLAKWDEPFGPLPPALENLQLTLALPNHGFGFEVFESLSAVTVDLACPGLRASLGAAAASLPRLTLVFDAEWARTDLHGIFIDCILSLPLTHDSVPCAFSGLEEFTLRLEGTGVDDGPHSADLVALLEAAPGLRRVRLEGIPNVSCATTVWLSAHRPGFRMKEREGVVVFELPPPG
jgi:hypothetical protein